MRATARYKTDRLSYLFIHLFIVRFAFIMETERCFTEYNGQRFSHFLLTFRRSLAGETGRLR